MKENNLADAGKILKLLSNNILRQVEQALCDQWTSNFPSSVLSRVIFNVIVENWNPELYPDDIAEDEDFIEHLFSMVRIYIRIVD